MRKSTIVSVASGVSSIVYFALYWAFESRNEHMGFHGDFQAAAASCAQLATYFGVLCVTSAVLSCVRGNARSLYKLFMARADRRSLIGSLKSFSDDDRFACAVLPGAHQLRKR
jgi:hypothetical protein